MARKAGQLSSSDIASWSGNKRGECMNGIA